MLPLLSERCPTCAFQVETGHSRPVLLAQQACFETTSRGIDAERTAVILLASVMLPNSAASSLALATNTGDGNRPFICPREDPSRDGPRWVLDAGEGLVGCASCAACARV
jgi:hypothetical protein